MSVRWVREAERVYGGYETLFIARKQCGIEVLTTVGRQREATGYWSSGIDPRLIWVSAVPMFGKMSFT